MHQVMAVVAGSIAGCGSGGRDLTVTGSQAGVTPFIRLVTLTSSRFPDLASVEFTIAPKPGATSEPVDISYSAANLQARRYLVGNGLTVPVIGLYAGYTNQVVLKFHYGNGSTEMLPFTVTTAPYVDAASTPYVAYSQPTILKKRDAGSTLGFSFFYMKSSVEAPVIMDTDGEIRWAVPGISVASSSTFQNGEFVIGDPIVPTVHRLALDGTLTDSALQSSIDTMFHHNIDTGKVGLLAEVNSFTDGITNLESTITEIDDSGAVLNQWDMAALLSAYMQSQGDDPSLFVRPGVDWFHSNSTTYDPRDDTLIVSSRENFVIKFDYHTGSVIWILGDPTKYWYTFPSLRAKALTLAPGGLYPIGQHALSITSDGLLLLFNDGLSSSNQPVGAPAGENRTYSAVSAYAIDATSRTAQEVWDFDYSQTILSTICSSAYESPDQSVLVDYATADNLTQARLVGLDPNHNVVFDFEYPTVVCDTSWNAEPIALEKLTIN
jgi:hypothetical protein